MIKLACPNRPRQIKKAIQIILQKNLATTIKRQNYIKSYYKDDQWKIRKQEEKILILIWCENLTKAIEIIEWIISEKIYIIYQQNE